MMTEDLRVINHQNDIDKEENDYKRYKGLVLINQMKVMLTSGFDVSKIYVALDVHVGNFSDPDDFSGLAHLCQRMTVLGTQKYPEYKQFEKFLKNHGGDMSLTISSDHTTYYFNMDKKDDCVFEEALDRFVQFFLTPLFRDSWIEEEIQAIDLKQHEYLQYNTNWIQYYDRGFLSSPHPYSKNGFCEKDILNKISTKQASFRVSDFFEKYYYGNIMTLCVVSDYSLCKIEKMIVNTFCQIRNKEIKILESYENPFKNQFCNQWCVVSQDYLKLLGLSFPLPNSKEDCWRDAVNFICYLLESKNENTLLQSLRNKNWCENISTSGYQEARNLNFFQVFITLKPDGYSNIENIITMFFQYIALFKERYLTSENGQSRLQEELHNMSKHRIIEEQQIFTQESLINLVKRLHEYSIKNILVNEYSGKFEYIVSMIKEILNNYILPQTIRIIVISNDEKQLEKKIPPGSTIYKSWGIKEPPSRMQQLCPKLSLPNLKFESNPIKKKIIFHEKVPEIIEDTSFIRLWYIHKEVPKRIQRQSKMFFHFISPHVYDRPLNGILNVIFAKLIKNVIKEDEYFPEHLIQWHIKSTKYGILLEVTSNTDMVYREFLSRMISKILNLKIRPKRFETFKRHFLKNLESFDMLKPMEQAFYYLSFLLSDKFWKYDEILEASASITIDKIKRFIQMFVRKMYVECLICGDISKEQALNIIRNVEIDMETANNNKHITMCSRIDLLPYRDIKLDDDTHVLFEAENKFHNVSCVQVYYQVGQETIDINPKLNLVCYMLSKMGSVYFQDFKRSINRICVKQRKIGGTQGFIIVVESSSLKPRIIQYHIEQLISYMLNYIRNISNEDLEKCKTELITIKYSKELELTETADAFWKEIFTESYGFGRTVFEKLHITNIKKEHLVTFYKQYIYDKKARLSVHVLPKCKDESKTESLSISGEFPSNVSESSDDRSIEPNIFKIRANIHKSSDFIYNFTPNVPAKPDKKTFASIISAFKKYYKKISKGLRTETVTPILFEQSFKKINNILLFKRSQGFYDQIPPIYTFHRKSEFPYRH